MLGVALATVTSALALNTAIITSDTAILRAAPRDSAQQQAVLNQGEMLEIRGERLDYLQVWDYQRERGGFVPAAQVRRVALHASEAPALRTVLRFVKDTPGQEALGIGLAAAWLLAAPGEAMQSDAGAEALDAMGVLADRLASRATSGATSNPPLGKAAQATLSNHLDVAKRYGVRFNSYEKDSSMQICYEGDAFRRVLAMPNALAEQQARAALALSRPECMDPQLRPAEQVALSEWRAEVLDRVKPATLPALVQNRLNLRRAGVWSFLAYQYARPLPATAASVSPSNASSNTKASAAATRAMEALAAVNKAELSDDDLALYNTAAMQTNASRWAAVAFATTHAAAKGTSIQVSAGQPGETCVSVGELRRCTYGQVWQASATTNREGNAMALAVQPMATWRELWIFRKQAEGWTLSILPPASTNPDTGYAEFAGWVPGGKQILIAREARGEGKYTRNFAVLNLDTLSAERQSNDPSNLGAFQRWQDPAWKRMTVSIR